MEPKGKWYQSSLAVVAFLFLFFPVGIFLMWKCSNWNKIVKIIVTGVFIVLIIGSTSSSKNTNANQTQTTNSTVSSTSAPEPTQNTKPLTTSDKLWTALDASMKTRKDYSVEYDETSKTASITKTEMNAWDESSMVREGFSTLVKYGREAFKVESVDSIRVVIKTEFTDQYGKKDVSDAVRIIMAKSEFNKFEWDNLKYQPVYNQIKNASEGFYIHPAILKNLKTDKLYLSI